MTLIDRINISLLAGLEQQRTVVRAGTQPKQAYQTRSLIHLQVHGQPHGIPGGGYGENFYESYFGRISANWDKKYYLEASFRRDGYSGLSRTTNGVTSVASLSCGMSRMKASSQTPD
jgi:hypothetical protein